MLPLLEMHMRANTSYVLELLDIIENQKALMEQKDQLIKELVLDNLEKENWISELSNEGGLAPPSLFIGG